MRRSQVLTALLLGVGLAAGCGSGVSAGAHAPAQNLTPSVVPGPGQIDGGRAYQSAGGSSCPSSATDPAIARLRAVTAESALPKGFDTVAVVRCLIDERAVAGDGSWQFAVAQRASAGLADLLRLLQQPNASAPARTQIACPADLLMVPDFGLVGSDGTVVRPKLPLTVCGAPMPNVLTALNGLPWKTETETKVTRIQTQAEIDTGCPSSYKYLPGFGLGGTPMPWSQVRHPPTAAIGVACVLRVDETTYPGPVGDFTVGKLLTAAQGTAVESMVDAASTAGSAAPPCSAKATHFATLGDRNDPTFLLELDGCRRLMFPDDYLATGPSVLFALLAQVGIK